MTTIRRCKTMRQVVAIRPKSANTIAQRSSCRGAASLRPMPARSQRLEPVAPAPLPAVFRLRADQLNEIEVSNSQPKISQEPKMKSQSFKYQFAALLFLFFSLAAGATAQEPLPSAAPVNVEGKWTISAKNPEGSVDTKYVELKQNGNQITGHFKGPNQSGGLEGTVNNRHIVFRTKTREVLTFRGQVNGDTIEGTFHTRRGTGEFHAYRDPATTNPS
jgi:hypothetical protein